MKIMVDKLPLKPSKCLFAQRVLDDYTCTFRKGPRICKDPSQCKFLMEIKHESKEVQD